MENFGPNFNKSETDTIIDYGHQGAQNMIPHTTKSVEKEFIHCNIEHNGVVLSKNMIFMPRTVRYVQYVLCC